MRTHTPVVDACVSGGGGAFAVLGGGDVRVYTRYACVCVCVGVHGSDAACMLGMVLFEMSMPFR